VTDIEGQAMARAAKLDAGVDVGAGASRPRSTKATVALLLAVLGLLLGFVFLFVVLTPAAIVVAALALRDIGRNEALRGRWRAWTAIALAIIGPVLWLAIFLAALAGGGAAGGALGLD